MERKRSFNIQTVTALFSLASAVGIAFIGYMLASLKVDMEILDQKIKHEEIMFEIKKFEASQRQEKRKLIIKYIPKLIYGDENVKLELLDILSALYPTEVDNIMRNIDKTLDSKKTAAEKFPIEPSAENTEETQQWGIVVGTDKSIEAAEHEVSRAEDQKYSPVIYKKGRDYVTMIGPFKNRMTVERITKRVKRKLNETSYIIDYRQWCRQQVARDQYIECAI